MFGLNKKPIYYVTAKARGSTVEFETTKPEKFKPGSIAHQEHGLSFKVEKLEKTKKKGLGLFY
jgi:hypothetical protein